MTKEWRLPTVAELEEAKRVNLFKDYFHSFYWSSDIHIDDNYVEVVYFGASITKACSLRIIPRYVRAVREASNGTLQWSKGSTFAMNWEDTKKWIKQLDDTAVYIKNKKE